MGGTPAFLQWPTRGFLERVSRVSRYPTCTAWYPFFSLVSTCRQSQWLKATCCWHDCSSLLQPSHRFSTKCSQRSQWLKAAPCHADGFVAVKRLYAQKGPRPKQSSIASNHFTTPQHNRDNEHLRRAAADPGAVISALPCRG